MFNLNVSYLFAYLMNNLSTSNFVVLSLFKIPIVTIYSINWYM